MKCNYLINILYGMMFFMGGCHGEEANIENTYPEHLQKLEDVKFFSPDIIPPDTVELIKETTFETNEDIFIDGYIGDVAIDDQGRVYISATKIGVVRVYIFQPDGTYLTSIADYGKGPGEYESIGSIDILNDKLYLFDPRLQKFGVFKLDNFTHLYDKMIDKENMGEDAPKLLRGRKLFAVTPNHIIVQFQVNTLTNINSFPQIYFYKLTREGVVKPGKILELEKYRFYMDKPTPGPDGTRYPFTMPFTRHSLFTISKSGNIYAAWTGDFLIKKFNKEGDYQHAFYYPVQNSSLSLSELEISNWKKNRILQDGVPNSWPVLHTMVLDDKKRLWVATITDSKTSFTWWVLNQGGELLVKFNLAGDRTARTVLADPLILIKNGYFYNHEFDFHNGIDRIVKYRIEMSE